VADFRDFQFPRQISKLDRRADGHTWHHHYRLRSDSGAAFVFTIYMTFFTGDHRRNLRWLARTLFVRYAPTHCPLGRNSVCADKHQSLVTCSSVIKLDSISVLFYIVLKNTIKLSVVRTSISPAFWVIFCSCDKVYHKQDERYFFVFDRSDCHLT